MDDKQQIQLLQLVLQLARQNRNAALDAAELTLAELSHERAKAVEAKAAES